MGAEPRVSDKLSPFSDAEMFVPGATPRCHAKRQKQGATRGATLNMKASDGPRRNERPQHLGVVSQPTVLLVDVGGVDGTRTRGLRRDRPAF
jgi:hypothetical protein